jgi:16S rRNA (uracil1498-N3)-methyltransferase
MHRFFVPADALRAATVTLSGDEAHHCLHVLRHVEGDRVILFDGCGAEVLGQLESAGRREASVQVLERRVSPPPACRITLAQAVPKGKNMDLIIEKAVELGATEIVPLLTERTVVRLDPAEAAAKQEKWQTIAREACKQCGQNWLPTVRVPTTMRGYFETAAPAVPRLIGSLAPGAESIKVALAACAEMVGGPLREIAIFIGPEGDFAPSEIDLALSHGCRPVTLGPIVLRTETAAIYCLSVLGHELFHAL